MIIRKIFLFFMLILFPFLVFSEEISWENRGCKIVLGLPSLEINFFKGSVANYEVQIADDCRYLGTALVNNGFFFVNDSDGEADLLGPETIKGEITLRPRQYGEGEIPVLEFLFEQDGKHFSIDAGPVAVTISSLLTADSQLLDLSVPEFLEKKSHPVLALIPSLGAALILFIISLFLQKKNTPYVSAIEEFRQSWSKQHEYKDDCRLFYQNLVAIFKRYLTRKYSINFQSKSLIACLGKLEEILGEDDQLLHDFKKEIREWDNIRFKKKYYPDIYWREDLDLIKKLVYSLEKKGMANGQVR